jgi:hypothetical protein
LRAVAKVFRPIMVCGKSAEPYPAFHKPDKRPSWQAEFRYATTLKAPSLK